MKFVILSLLLTGTGQALSLSALQANTMCVQKTVDANVSSIDGRTPFDVKFPATPPFEALKFRPVSTSCRWTLRIFAQHLTLREKWRPERSAA